MITGGGIIRWVLQDCGMGDIIGPALEKSGLPLVLVAFLIAALIRASVGAAVVAMTMAAGIMAAMPGVAGSDHRFIWQQWSVPSMEVQQHSAM